MSSVYFFSNETKNEFVYVNNVGTYSMEIENIVETICQKKKWDVSDKVVVIPLNDTRTFSGIQLNDKHYCYQNKIFSMDYKNNPKYEWLEIETDKESKDNYEDYDDYNYEDIEDDRYDERDDYDNGNGYEDESFECCDM